MSIRTLLSRASRKPLRGRPLLRRARATTAGARRRGVSRDPARRSHSSDTIWALVERMMGGDADAALVVSDAIEEGVQSGTTKFVKITRKAWTRKGHTTPAFVKPGMFAAITPGSSIVLFGMERQFRGGQPGGVMVGYLRRFRMGDQAEYGGYNLTYYGPIVSITAKQVRVAKRSEGRREVAAMDIEAFSSMNREFDLDVARKRNANWSD